MLKKTQRLLTKRVNEVITTGQVAHSPLFTLRFAVGVYTSGHIAAVAPVKIAKTAALRNRTKRRIYDAVGPILESLASPYDLVLIAKSPALEADTTLLAKDIKELFVKAKIVR